MTSPSGSLPVNVTALVVSWAVVMLWALADGAWFSTAPSLAPSFWIDFEEARNAVETIVDVAHDDPEERPTCIVLTGQSGMGKTSILREAQRRQHSRALPAGRKPRDPVVDFVCLAFSRPLTSAEKAIAAHNAVSSEPIEITRETRIRYAFGQGYLALIMETEKYFRYSPFQYGWWRNVLAAILLYRAAFRELGSK